MQGIFVCLIAAWLLLAAALMLSTVRFTARLRTRMAGGGGTLCAEWMLLHLCVPIRLNLMRSPSLTVQILRGDGQVRTTIRFADNTKKKKPALHVPAPTYLHMHAAVGIKDEPAVSAMLCGWICEAANTAIRIALSPEWPARFCISAEPVCADNCFCLNLTGIFELTAVQIIKMIIQGSRGR